MDYDPDERPGWVRLPGQERPGQERPGPAAPGRADGVRRVRRASNWTAAALIAGVAAATGYFAHHTAPAVPTAGTATQPPAAGQVPVAGHGAAAPHQASAPVATSGGSGVATGSAPGTAGGVAGQTVTWRDN